MRVLCFALVISLFAWQWSVKGAAPLLAPATSETSNTTANPAAEQLSIPKVWPDKMILADKRVQAFAFSPNSNALVFSGGNPRIRLIQMGTWKEFKSLAGHSGIVWDLCFSSDGSLLVSGSDDGTARVWDMKTSSQIALFNTGEVVHGVAFLKDDKRVILAGSSGRVSIWDVDKESLIKQFDESAAQIYCLSLSGDGKRVATGDFQGTINVWDIASGKKIASIKTVADLIDGVALSPDGKTVLAAEFRKPSEVWNVDTQQLLKSYDPADLSRIVADVAFAKHTNAWLFAGQEGIFVNNADTGSPRIQLVSYVTQFFRVAVSPNGRWVVGARGGELPGLDDKDASRDQRNPGSSVDVWDMGNPLKIVHGGAVHAIAIDSSHKNLASAGADGIVKVSDASTGKPISTLKGSGELRTVAISPDGRHVIAGGDSAVAQIWPTAGGEAVLTKTSSPVTGVAFLTNTLAAVSSGKSVTFINITSDHPVTSEFENQIDPILHIAASSDGRRLAIADEKSVHVWDVATRKSLWNTKPAESANPAGLSFSTDGKHLLIADKSVGSSSFNADTGKLETQFKVDGSNNCTGATWSPDGSLCGVWRDARGGIAIFKPDASKILQSVANGMWRIESAVFLDNTHLLCGTTDGLVAKFELTSMSEDFPAEIVQTGVKLLSISPDGACGISTAPFEMTRTQPTEILWDLQKKTVITRFDSKEVVALSANHLKLAAVYPAPQNQFFIKDISSGVETKFPLAKSSRGRQVAATAIAFSPDLKYVAAAVEELGQTIGTPREIRLFNVDTQEMIRSIPANEASIPLLTFSPQGNFLVSTSGSDVHYMGRDGNEIDQDKSTRIFRVADGSEFKKIDGGPLRVAQLFTPDSKQFLLVNEEGLIVTYDTTSFEEANRMRVDRATGAALSPNGKFILVVSPSADAKIFSLETRRQVGSIPHRPDAGIYPMALFLPDGHPGVWVNGTTLRLQQGEVPQ